MTRLLINFQTSARVELKLEQNGEQVDTLMVWPPEAELVDKGSIDFHFDTVLVTSVDKILKRNKIQSSSLDHIQVVGDYEQSSLSFFIAEAVAGGLKTK